ncbi:MAG: hypothetical protein U5K75_03400 [Ahrensia sp.]|nr:hypothetical protein [Ahrensia sp.]
MIHDLTHTTLKLVDAPLPFEAAHKAHIDVFWNQAFEANPRLWNGVFYMFSDVKIEDGVLRGNGHKTDFATFLYWRDHVRCASVTHITGTSFPILADGSLLAIEMAAHTANAGRVYFPAGSFDRADIIDGHFDVVTNFSRELEEEIGITLEPAWLYEEGTGLLAVEAGGAFHITRPLRLPMSFERVEKMWRTHIKNGGDDEIARLVQITSALHIPHLMPDYARELCAYHFGCA